MKRPKVAPHYVDHIFAQLNFRLGEALKKRGDGAFVSAHEILGSLMEETKELVEAIHTNRLEGTKNELFDIAITAIFGIASLNALEEEEL